MKQSALIALSLSLLLGLAAVLPIEILAQGGPDSIITHTTINDFDSCSILVGSANRELTDVTLSPINGGEIRLVPLLEDWFDSGPLDSQTWEFALDPDPGDQYPTVTPKFSNGVVRFQAGGLRSKQTFSQSRIAVEGSIKFGDSTTTGWADFGFGKFSQVAGSPNILYITDNIGLIWANSNHPDNGVPIKEYADDQVTTFQTYRIVVDEWRTADFYINGTYIRTQDYQPPSFPNPIFNAPAHLWLFSLLGNDTTNPAYLIYADWLRVAYYEVPSGAYTSCASDAGEVVNWSLGWTAEVPPDTAVAFKTRTSVDGVTWSPWATQSGNGTAISSPSGRYLQYQAHLSTDDPAASPELQAVTLSTFGPNQVAISPAFVNLQAGATHQFEGQVADLNGRSITQVPLQWQTNGGGSINSSGLFTAGTTPGFYPDAVTVSSNGLTATATVAVAIQGFEMELPPLGERDQPFTATIRLRDAAGGVVNTFSQMVFLSTPDGGSITPDQVLLQNGAWSGTLTLSQTGLNKTVRVQYETISGLGQLDVIPFELYLPLIQQ